MSRLPYLLLAELSLVLAVIALAAQSPLEPIEQTTTVPETTSTTEQETTTRPTLETTSTSSTTTTTTMPLPEGALVDRVPVHLCATSTDSQIRAEDFDEILSQLAESDEPGEVSVQDLLAAETEAVIVLVWNDSTSDANSSQYSEALGEELQQEFPGVFERAAMRGFWKTLDPGVIVLEAYVRPVAGVELFDSATCPPIKTILTSERRTADTD